MVPLYDENLRRADTRRNPAPLAKITSRTPSSKNKEHSKEQGVRRKPCISSHLTTNLHNGDDVTFLIFDSPQRSSFAGGFFQPSRGRPMGGSFLYKAVTLWGQGATVIQFYGKPLQKPFCLSPGLQSSTLLLDHKPTFV